LLNPAIKSLAERILPGWIVRRLDPVQALIDEEIARSARRNQTVGIVLDAGAGEARCRHRFRAGGYIALDHGGGDAAWDYTCLDVRGDLHRLPLRSESVDEILCMVVLEHTRNPRLVVEEFARLLKPGGMLRMVVPLLWEEHQVPNDFFRFTRYGLGLLFEELPFEIDRIEPIGGFFRVAARRCVNLLGFFQRGWLWVLWPLLVPFFGLMFPLLLNGLDGLDREKSFTLGFFVRAKKPIGRVEMPVL